MFTYKTEKELHEYLVKHFNDFFDFDYISSEFIITGGRIDILGKDDNTIYVVELKRDFVTNATIEQLSNYIPEIQSLNPDKVVLGIAVAPKIDDKVNIDSLPSNITIKTLDNVKFIEPEHNFTKKRVTFTLEEELIEQLKEVSEKTMIPQARLVEKALQKIIEEYKDKGNITS